LTRPVWPAGAAPACRGRCRCGPGPPGPPGRPGWLPRAAALPSPRRGLPSRSAPGRRRRSG
jgi:hypothetical protein